MRGSVKSIHMIEVINSQQPNGSVNTPGSINQYSGMAPKASGQITILNGVFFFGNWETKEALKIYTFPRNHRSTSSWIGKKNWEFEATLLKTKKSENHKKVSGHLCNIPITTRSGIEVEHFSPVAISLSQTINLVHSIFFWVDIHCYVCQNV